MHKLTLYHYKIVSMKMYFKSKYNNKGVFKHKFRIIIYIN